jgi:hypothetical protein
MGWVRWDLVTGDVNSPIFKSAQLRAHIPDRWIRKVQRHGVETQRLGFPRVVAVTLPRMTGGFRGELELPTQSETSSRRGLRRKAGLPFVELRRST